MYTSNPAYKIWPKKTAKRLGQEAMIKSATREFAVGMDQIVYLPSTKYYTFERADIIRHYLKRMRHHIHCGSIIFSDNARIYVDKNQPITTSLRASTARYPAEVHQYMSPNDNRLNGLAKAKWRKFLHRKITGVEGRVSSDICLLSHLTHVEPDVLRGFFAANLFLDSRALSIEKCKEHIMDTENTRQSKKLYHAKLLAEYKRYMRGRLVQEV